MSGMNPWIDIVMPGEAYWYTDYNTTLTCYHCDHKDLELFLKNIRYVPHDPKRENGLRTLKLHIRNTTWHTVRQTALYPLQEHRLEVPFFIEPVNQEPEVKIGNCFPRELKVDFNSAELVTASEYVNDWWKWNDDEAYRKQLQTNATRDKDL